MSQHRSTKIVPSAGLALAFAALLLPAAPAQASEVVKLARLVITGKRLSTEPPPRPTLLPEPATATPSQQPQTPPPALLPQPLPRAVIEGRRGGEDRQMLAQRRPSFWLL